MSYNDKHSNDSPHSSQYQQSNNSIKPHTASSSQQQQQHTSSSLNYVPTAKFIDMESKLYRNQAEIDKLIKISLQHRSVLLI